MSEDKPVMTCEECELDCEYRGVSPVVIENNGYTCTVLQEDKKSCLVSIPVGVMVDTSSGNARTVRVDFKRIRKGSKWKRQKL